MERSAAQRAVKKVSQRAVLRAAQRVQKKERINSARNLIKAGVASLDALKASGIYTPQEIEAIMAP